MQALRQQAMDAGRRIAQIGFVANHLGQHLAGILASEQPLSGNEFVQHHAERKDVRALVGGLAPRLFGRHIGRGAQDHSGFRHADGEGGRALAASAGSGRQFRQSKVEHLHAAVGFDLDVGGLQVAMRDAPFVGRFQRVGNLMRDA